MIIKIKKRDLLFASLPLFALLVLISILSTPIIYSATTNTTFGGFLVQLVISNQNPTVYLVNLTTIGVDPVDGGDTTFFIVFNVTDADGVQNINATTAIVNITLGTPNGAQFRANVSNSAGNLEIGTCGNVSYPATNTVMMNCSITMRYFDNASSNWVINISVQDTNGATGRNSSDGSGPNTLTYNELTAISLPVAAINFSNVNLGAQNQEVGSTLILNNTGNIDFTKINMSAADLVGTTDTGKSIAIANFYANFSNEMSTGGLQLSEGAAFNLLELGGGNATLEHGHATSASDYNDGVLNDRGNRSLFFWVDVPSSGLSAQLYNATWNLTFIS